MGLHRCKICSGDFAKGMGEEGAGRWCLQVYSPCVGDPRLTKSYIWHRSNLCTKREAWGSQTLGFDLGIQHSAWFCSRHLLWSWAVPLHAFFASLSNYQHGDTIVLVWLLGPWTFWGGHHLGIAPSRTQSCCPHGSVGLPVLWAMNGNHHHQGVIKLCNAAVKKNPSYKAHFHTGALQSNAVIWVLLVHVNKHDRVIVTSVNKHDWWVS